MGIALVGLQGEGDERRRHSSNSTAEVTKEALLTKRTTEHWK